MNIFNYFDYRKYLDDCFQNIKSKRRGFSFRAFSRELGVQSHNFLPRILRRERNLSEEFIPSLAAFLRLNGAEVRYFKALIAFNDAKKPSVKQKLLKRLFALRIVNEDHKIQDEKLHFYEPGTIRLSGSWSLFAIFGKITPFWRAHAFPVFPRPRRGTR